MNRSYKNPENFLMCIGNYAYDPYVSAGERYIQIAHRVNTGFRLIVKIIRRGSTFCVVPVLSSMPQSCINEFAQDLQRNLELLVRCCENA